MEINTIKNRQDVESLDVSDEAKNKMMIILEKYSQFAYIVETGDMIAGVDFDGNLDTSMLEIDKYN